jgi:hypothetical protein
VSVNWNFELTNVALLAGAIVAAIYARRQLAAVLESNQRRVAKAGAHPKLCQSFIWLVDQVKRRDAIS